VVQHAGGRIRTGDPSDEPPAPATAPKQAAPTLAAPAGSI
jgi:hypothetical protein